MSASVLRVLVCSLVGSRVHRVIHSSLPFRQIHIAHGVSPFDSSARSSLTRGPPRSEAEIISHTGGADSTLSPNSHCTRGVWFWKLSVNTLVTRGVLPLEHKEPTRMIYTLLLPLLPRLSRKFSTLDEGCTYLLFPLQPITIIRN